MAHDDGLRSAEDDLRCPIPLSHDKFDEAHYFLERMMREYHHPHQFRWNLNAFLQSLRTVDYMIRRELATREGFQAWYTEQINQAGDDLRRIFRARRVVVHEGNLRRQSNFQSGFFRGRMLKLAWSVEVRWDAPSEYILERSVEAWTGLIMDKEHSAIGEQVGIRREWIVEELGDEEVLTVCDRGWLQAAEIVARAHVFAEPRFAERQTTAELSAPCHDVNKVNVLLESDLDPSLIRKWGWPRWADEQLGENPLLPSR